MTNQVNGSTEWCDFNPKKLPNRKNGKCENSEHEDWQSEPPTEEELHLVMFYSDFYNNMIETSKEGMTDDENDALWDEALSKKWKPNSETYWCKNCLEFLE